MENFPLYIRCLSEVLATAMLIILGNGAVANADLKGTKGHGTGWLLIALGYGCGVMLPAMIFGGVSGNHINPAFTLGLAIFNLFPWSEVLPYIISQVIGAMLGQLIVVAAYKPFYDKTENLDEVFGTFSTAPAAKGYLNGFISEFIGSFVLFFSALGVTKAPFFSDNLGTAHLALGFVVMTLVISLGGPTGPALNPARDFGPRIIHQILPLKHKGSSHWDYAWVPIVAPILGSIAAIATFQYLIAQFM